MKHCSFTALLVVFLSVGMMLPTISKAQSKKCEKAIKKAEKACDCSLSPAKNERDHHKKRSRRHRRIKGDGPVIASRQPDGSFVFTSTVVEDGDTTLQKITKKENGDSIITWITDDDTTVQEITTSTTITKGGDTLTERNVIEDEEVVTSEKILHTRCPVPVPVIVKKEVTTTTVTKKQDTVPVTVSKTDTLKWSYIPKTGKVTQIFWNKLPRPKHSPELIKLIFTQFPEIEWVRIVHLPDIDLLILKGIFNKDKVREAIDIKFGRLENESVNG